MTMIPLQPSWSFNMDLAMEFTGAHGEEIVRDVLIDNQVSPTYYEVTGPF